ncbi:MAG: ABC transporter ATP-binding protein [Pikeienuella sp.]|uniref:ABC transporter ATP-binding protein n=1 Tax=Pikeienuella sp. TaxID=2831957 RepID=UPI0039195560
MLKVEGVKVRIGAVEAVRDFSMEAPKGAMIGLAGRNGAGKTTVMRAVMGLAKLAAGRVEFDGQDLAKVDVHRRAALGIGYMPETRGLIPDLTVEENILLPTWVTPGLDGATRLRLVYEIMPELKEMADRKALLLSGGQQKMAALGRALTAGTRLLLLDEPFEGVAPALAQRLSDVISGLRAGDLTVVMSMSELTHSETMLDRVWGIERGANMRAAA